MINIEFIDELIDGLDGLASDRPDLAKRVFEALGQAIQRQQPQPTQQARSELRPNISIVINVTVRD